MKKMRTFVAVGKVNDMTATEQALYVQMQEMGYSHGLCVVALQILSQSKRAVDDMLLFLCDEQPSERQFINEMARICTQNDLSLPKTFTK